MSRCFPFPPPGYEKKARTDDADLLKKEKHREKKHKKEKKDKDKEKREDKDRKEKDKSNGKHKDKKDRKEKSKEKKDREREKDKSKASTSKEKTTSAQVESVNGEKLNHSDREWGKYPNVTSNDIKQRTQFHDQVGEKTVGNSLSNDGGIDKFVLDLCARIKDEEKGSASQSMERISFSGRTDHERMAKSETGIMYMEKERKRDSKVDIRKIDGKGVMGDATAIVSKVVQSIAAKDKCENRGVNVGGLQPRTEEMPRILEKNVDTPRVKIYKESENKRGDKRKDKDKEKKSHGKDKEREKEKKKEEKAKERSEKKTKDHDKVKDSIKNGHVNGPNIRLPPLHVTGDGDRNTVADANEQVIKDHNKLKDSIKNGHVVSPNVILPPLHVAPDGGRNATVEGNLKKRKDIEANGFLHENLVVPNKKLRPTPHPVIENGRKLEPCQTPVLHTPDRKAPPDNLIKVNNNEQKLNGMIEVQPQPLSISLKKPSSSSKSKADKIVQASVKPPHPDTKYLSEVLSVPRIEEWCGFDDEDWLLSCKDRVSKSVGPTGASETPRVWAEAMQIESADVCALPYVIPY